MGERGGKGEHETVVENDREVDEVEGKIHVAYQPLEIPYL